MPRRAVPVHRTTDPGNVLPKQDSPPSGKRSLLSAVSPGPAPWVEHVTPAGLLASLQISTESTRGPDVAPALRQPRRAVPVHRRHGHPTRDRDELLLGRHRRYQHRDAGVPSPMRASARKLCGTFRWHSAPRQQRVTRVEERRGGSYLSPTDSVDGRRRCRANRPAVLSIRWRKSSGSSSRLVTTCSRSTRAVRPATSRCRGFGVDQARRVSHVTRLTVGDGAGVTPMSVRDDGSPVPGIRLVPSAIERLAGLVGPGPKRSENAQPTTRTRVVER